MIPITKPPFFQSFVWAGFECTFCKTEIKERLDMLKETRHDEYCRLDYGLIKERGISTVREGLAWSLIDNGTKKYDFSRFERMMQIAKEEGVQQIWDLNHFDFPDYLDPLSRRFITRFKEYALRAHSLIRKYQDRGTITISPICEISFFAWIGADRGVWAPYTKGEANGLRFKKQLAAAAIAAMGAIWKEDKGVRFLHVDPFMRRKPLPPANDLAIEHAKDFNEKVRFEAWDMLAGKVFPELGGEPRFLDIVGMNYYFHNQEWVVSNKDGTIGHKAMPWESPARVSFADMIQDVYERYQRPIAVGETGSFGALRFKWWTRVLKEVDEAMARGLPVYGVCAYPAIDRPEHIDYLIPQSGLWDFAPGDKKCLRVPHKKTLAVIEDYAQRKRG